MLLCLGGEGEGVFGRRLLRFLSRNRGQTMNVVQGSAIVSCRLSASGGRVVPSTVRGSTGVVAGVATNLPVKGGTSTPRMSAHPRSRRRVAARMRPTDSRQRKSL